MAHIRKLPSGKWNAVVRHPSGRRVSKTDALKKVVVLWAAEQETAYRAGASSGYRDKGMTLDAWADRWMAARSVEASTARKEEAALRLHIRPHLGSWPLDTIDRIEVQKWANGRAKAGVGPGAIRTAYGLLSIMLGDAVHSGLLLASPCSRIKLPRVPKPVPRWFTRDEYDRIQLALAGRTIAYGGREWRPDPHVPTWQAMIGLACYTGLRPSELAGLDVRNLDLERGMVYVEQVWTRERTLRAYGKSDKAHRWVPFPPTVADLLWRVVADKRPADPVFSMPRGGRLAFEGNIRNHVWMPTLEAAGIEPVRFYTCRHTFASWAVQAGVPDRELMNYLGHADTHLIDVYAHLDPHKHESIRAMWGELATHSRPTANTGPNDTDVFSQVEAEEWAG